LEAVFDDIEILHNLFIIVKHWVCAQNR